MECESIRHFHLTLTDRYTWLTNFTNGLSKLIPKNFIVTKGYGSDHINFPISSFQSLSQNSIILVSAINNLIIIYEDPDFMERIYFTLLNYGSVILVCIWCGCDNNHMNNCYLKKALFEIITDVSTKNSDWEMLKDFALNNIHVFDTREFKKYIKNY
jgi:hypothetical protein